MFKTIFAKLMGSNIAILFVSFFLTGVLLFSMLGNYAVRQKASDLQEIAPTIAEMTVSMQIERNDLIYRKIYIDNLNTISAISSSHIIIANTKGEIVAKTSRISDSYTTVNSEYLREPLSGSVLKTTGNFGGIFSETVLTVGYPVVYNNEVAGVVFMNAPLPNLDRDRFNTGRLFIAISAAVILVALIISYLISQKMSRSLKSINQAAKNIASGNFKARVNVKGKDEIAQLGATFNYMADSLQQLDDTHTAFIVNVSHELRTPMTTISGFIENVLNGTIPKERANEYLEIALSESKRLARLVTDMLDISKMSLGQFSLDMKPFDLAEMIRLTVIKFENAIENKKLDVNIDFPSEHVNVIADRDSISRVITNLMDNAVKFSDPAAHLDIKVFTKCGKAYTAVTNEGFGIESEDLPHVFDRFFKTDKSRNDKKGTGLGLYLAKNILSIHNENIVVNSVDISDEEYGGNPNHPAKRTTFIFSLELA